MKNLNKLNYFFVGTPIISCLFGILFGNGNAIGFGVLFSILTGLFQVTAGIKMLIKFPEDKNLKNYIISVILFFSTLFIVSKIGMYDWINYILVIIPPILAIYLSIIIYKKANK